MTAETLFAPAKLNLFLAITGQRSDGFHDLLSVVAPLQFGDSLTAMVQPGSGYTLDCEDRQVPTDESNLILRAAKAFAAATGWDRGVAFRLEKRIPMGAGLGGGSSNAVAALRAMNRLAGEPMQRDALAGVAATLGSDCPLFLHDGPVVMRGRGERVEPLAPGAATRLRGRRVLVFKPEFGVPTAWAYRQMAEMARNRPGGGAEVYIPTAAAEQRLASWIEATSSGPESLLFNNMEAPAFAKFVALPTMLELLGKRFGLAPRMTGSGSACFTFLPDRASVPAIVALIRAGWGDTAFAIETALL